MAVKEGGVSLRGYIYPSTQQDPQKMGKILRVTRQEPVIEASTIRQTADDGLLEEGKGGR